MWNVDKIAWGNIIAHINVEFNICGSWYFDTPY